MKQLVKEFVVKLKQLSEPIKILANQTPDGLCSAAIFTSILADKKYSIQFIKNIDEKLINALNRDSAESFIFLDISDLKLNERLHKPQIIINHHSTEYSSKIFTLNPNLKEIKTSTSILSYLVAKEFNQTEQISLGVLGFLSEFKEINDFNKIILDEAIHRNKIQIKLGTNLFSCSTQQLHKALEFSTNPFLPGLTGSEEAVINFLKENNIPLKENSQIRTMLDLSEDEIKKLIIILSKNTEAILTPIYLLTDEPPYVKDSKEYIKTLDITSKLNKPSLGLGLCLKNDKLRKQAVQLKDNYVQELIKALNWFHSSKIYAIENYVIINAESKVQEDVLEDFATSIINSKIYNKDLIYIFMAQSIDGKTNILLRSNLNYNFKQLLLDTPNELQLQFSQNFAQIPTEFEKAFIAEIVPRIKGLYEVIELPKTI